MFYFAEIFQRSFNGLRLIVKKCKKNMDAVKIFSANFFEKNMLFCTIKMLNGTIFAEREREREITIGTSCIAFFRARTSTKFIATILFSRNIVAFCFQSRNLSKNKFVQILILNINHSWKKSSISFNFRSEYSFLP